MPDRTYTAVEGDPFAEKPAAPPAPTRRAPKLTPVQGDPFTESTATGAFRRNAGRSVAPALAGTTGFGAGFATAGTIAAPTEAIPVAGPFVHGGLALAGGLAGAFGAGYLVDKAQDKLLSVLPASVAKFLGQDPSQRAADETQHPTASYAGSMAPMILSMRPGFAARSVAPGASKLTRVLASPATGAAVGASLGAATEGAQQYTKGEFDAARLAISMGAGAALNRPTALGSRLFQAGGNSAIRAAQLGARGAGVAYRGTVDAATGAAQAARDARDIRSGALIENPAQPTGGVRQTIRGLPSPKLMPVDGDPFAPPGSDVVAPTPTAPTGALRLVPVTGDPFAAPSAAPLPPEAVAPASPLVVEPQPIVPEPAAAGGGGLRPEPSISATVETPTAGQLAPVLHAADLRPDPGPLADGEHYVTTPAGNRVRSKYEVVPAASLQAATGDLQNRDRSRDTTDLQVQDIVAGFDPTRLGASSESDRGAPIVGPDGTVESGNGRMLALDRIQSDPQYAAKAEAYRAFIEAEGHATDGIENPRLVRRRTNDFTPEQRRQFVVDSNKDAKLAMTSVERARSDADSLDGDALSLYRGGDIGNAGNSDFVKRFNSRLTKAELAGQIDGEGRVSQDGLVRIENALMARAYENPAVLSKLIEARDNNIRSIGAGMLDNAAGWAKLRADVKEGRVKPEFDVTDRLVEAARRVSDIRAKGTKIGDALSQDGMFEEKDPIVESFMRAFYNPDLTRAASREAITAAISSYARRASEQTTEPKLFGGGETTPERIIADIVAERNAQSGNLFAQAAEDRAPVNDNGDLDTWHDEVRARRQARLGTEENENGNGTQAARGPEGRNGKQPEKVSGAGRDEGQGEGRAPGREGSGEEGGRGLNDEPDYTTGRSPALKDAGPYDPSFASRSFTNRASLFNSAAEALGIDPDKFTLMPAPRQVSLLRDAMQVKFGVEVTVDHGMQERFAIDQMLDAFQNVQGMAHVLDLPNAAISLGGKLKLKLQKQGNFLGQFQPGANVITLPQRSNSFAHEWAHALDFHLLSLVTEPGKGLSGSIRANGNDAALASGQPANVREAFVDLLNAMFFDKAGVAQKIMTLEAKILQTESSKVKAETQLAIDKLKAGNSKVRDISTAFHKNAKSFDGPGGEYWSSPTEMFARAFEAYTSYKAEAAGLTTEFIGKGDAGYLSDADKRFAKTFPKGEERAVIFAAFEQVFGNLADEQLLGKGVGAEKPAGSVRRMTDYDKTPVVARERNVIKREIAAIKAHVRQSQKEAANRPDDAKGMMEKVRDLQGATFMSMTGNLRMIQGRSNSRSLQKLTDLLTKQDGRGDRTVARTFAEDVHLQSKAAINRLGNILKANGVESRSAAQDMELRDLLTGSREDAVTPGMLKAASAIRHLLDNEFYVNQQAGIDLGYTRNGYLARVLDLPKVYGDQPGFTRAAAKVYDIVFDKEFGTDAAALISGSKTIVTGKSKGGNAVLAQAETFPTFMKMAIRMGKSNDFPALAVVRGLQKQIAKLEASKEGSDDPAAIQAKMDALQPDLVDAVGDLMNQVKPAYSRDRAEAWLGKINLVAGQENNASSPDSKYTKHRELPAEADKIMEQFYLSDPVESVTNYLVTSARRTAYARRFGADGKKRLALFEGMAAEGVSPEDQRTVERILNIATGRMRSELAPSAQKAAAFVNAAGTMALLPRAVISSLAEPFTAGLVTGDARSGFKMLAMTIGGALGSPSGKVRFELARAMGIISDAASDDIMESRYGQTYADETRWDRYTATMFRRTGLTGLTRAQKTAGIGLGHAFLDSLSHKIAEGGGTAKDQAVALMRELGVRDHEKFAAEIVATGRLPTPEEIETDFGHDYATAQLRFSQLVVQEPGAMDRPELSQNPVGRVVYGITGFSYGYWRNIVKRNGILIAETGKRRGNGKAALYGGQLFAAAAVAYLIGTTVSTIREKLLNPKRWAELEAKGELESQMAQLGFTRTFSFGAADTVIQTWSGLKYQRDFSNVFVGPGLGFMLQNAQKIAPVVPTPQMKYPFVAPPAQSRKTNSGEYGALQGAYSAASPFLAFGLARVPGGPLVGAGTGAAMAYVTSANARDAFATAVVGPKSGSVVDGVKTKAKATSYDRALDSVFGVVAKKPPPEKKSANPYSN